MEKPLVLSTSRLTKKYGDQVVIGGIDMSVKKGRIYGLIGRNGAGKTTIMKMILGLTAVSSGDIWLFNQPLKQNEEKLYPRVGSIIETPCFYAHLTGTENLKIFARLRGTISKSAVEQALTVVGLPFEDQKPFSAYSMGMKQRLGIANAILNDPELLILDEPTNGLDPIGIAEMRVFLKDLSREQGKTIIISSHILSEITLLADDIGIVHNGVLLEECSVAELEERAVEYILLKTEDIKRTVYQLENELGIEKYTVEESGFIKIYDKKVSISFIGKALIDNGIGITHLEQKISNLEDHFKLLTGGGISG
ncbi:ATP-binding cassette domain-containing protein [Enterococcus sp. LJL51]|uniref:ATP-binding cassette domain-containing protein n=1 Tax=Enterococcus sp. LJL51 TaxID=3416656 RepID=UPI003CEDD871